ncbi:CehA/McbA family metallohydrolase [Congregibacter sp.]|uniref:CehA/McbA family metallohydrolase n=1 Tax=Congregibacter sp. TaxID=2744308 RepID=UPI0039E60999
MFPTSPKSGHISKFDEAEDGRSPPAAGAACRASVCLRFPALYSPVGGGPAQTLSAVIVACALLFFCLDGRAQSRVDFHLLPAISTGPLDPDWSPDSSQLAFAMRGDLWVIPASGGTARARTQGPHYYSEPAWSPDGSKLAFTVDRDGNLDIGIVDSARGDVEILTSHAEDDFAPAWSGDGQSLYFATRRAGNLDILRLDLSTGQVAPVAHGPGNQYQPAVSPNGHSLAFVASVEGRNGSGGIWVMPLPAGQPRLVHYEESSYRMKPHWSADGASLFYVSDVAGTNNIARIPVAGGNRVWVTENPAGEFDAAPSPDGRHVAFVSNELGPTALQIVGSAGGPRPLWTTLSLRQREALAPTGVIRGRVLDQSGDPVAARLMLVASDGRAYTEDGKFHRMVPATRTHYQHTDGSFEIEVPAGLATVEAMRGFEFTPASVQVRVPANGTVAVDLRIQALATPRDNGWYSGDMHVHDLHEGRYGLTHEDFFQQLHADDLGVANALIHMDGTKIMGRWSDLTGTPSPLSNDRTILRYSQEYRGYFGHLALVGLDTFQMPLIGGVPYTPFAPDILGIGHIDGARAQGAIAGFVHPFNQPTSTPEEVGKRDIPVLAALGKADFYDVVSIASRELESAAVYYRLLNAGIRLAATGGTDNFSDVWFDPSGGAARTYARLQPGAPFTFENWLAAVRAGRTFATNGPLLFLSVDGREPGDELRRAGDDSNTHSVTVSVSSIAPLDRVELIVNGKVVQAWQPGENTQTWSFSTTITLPDAGWIAARAIGPASPYVGDAFAFAQTSPVHVLRDGQSFSSAADAAFLAESLATTWRLAEARDTWLTTAQKSAYQSGISAALDYYRRSALKHPEDAVFSEQAPAVFKVRLETSKGLIVIEMHREWSPLGVDRLYNLVRFGYYDDMRIHRIRHGDFVQFGINGDPSIAKAWRDQPIADDPVVVSNLRGTFAFAHGEPRDDRTTQVYINLRDKPEMDSLGFSIIGRVIEGMDVADSLYSGYGERAGGGIRGGKQAPVFDGGNAFLDLNYPRLDRILRGTIAPPDNRESTLTTEAQARREE